MYPYLFQPILKEIIWGGTDIRPFKGMTPTQEKIGESWELSHVDGDFSVVAYGADKGKTIDELIREYGESLLCSEVMKRFGTRFPLLIKFIDAWDDLSIQVHPDDVLAEKRHHSFGKTEMWYVIKATPDAALYCGFVSGSQAAGIQYLRNSKKWRGLSRQEGGLPRTACHQGRCPEGCVGQKERYLC